MISSKMATDRTEFARTWDRSLNPKWCREYSKVQEFNIFMLITKSMRLFMKERLKRLKQNIPVLYLQTILPVHR